MDDRIAFEVAGVTVAIRMHGFTRDDLAVGYREFAVETDQPDIDLEIECVGGYQISSDNGVDYPSFTTTAEDDGIRFARNDAEGALFGLGTNTVHGRFRTGRASREAAIRIAVCCALPFWNALIVHGSCLAINNRAHLFVGPSGAGKSTLAELLFENTAAVRLSDDLVGVRRTANGWYAYALPFASRLPVQAHASALVASINTLIQGPAHHRRPLARAELTDLSRAVMCYAAGPKLAAALLENIVSLYAARLVHRLTFANNPSVVEVLNIT